MTLQWRGRPAGPVRQPFPSWPELWHFRVLASIPAAQKHCPHATSATFKPSDSFRRGQEV